MNRKLLIAIAIISLLLCVFIILWIRGRGCPLQGETAATVSLSGLLNQAKDLEAKNKVQEARDLYKKLVVEFPNSNEVMDWQRRIESLNMKLLLSPAATENSASYEIKPGDNLIKIAKKFNTTAELIMQSNNLKDDKILPGQKIKVWTAPFTIVIDKSQNLLFLKSGEEIIKTYLVSTGKDNSTPIGTFKIINKLKDPTWFKAGTVVPAGSPENILGTRWLGFDMPGYGIHGTTDPQNLGKQVTQGCVRMNNSEVEELFIVIPVGTEVTIVD